MAYALGMGTTLTGLAVAMVLARLAGLLLGIAGACVTRYAVYQIRLDGDDDVAPGPVAVVTEWSGPYRAG